MALTAPYFHDGSAETLEGLRTSHWGNVAELDLRPQVEVLANQGGRFRSSAGERRLRYWETFSAYAAQPDRPDKAQCELLQQASQLTALILAPLPLDSH